MTEAFPQLLVALRHFWTWWIGELAAMLPSRARVFTSRRAPPVDLVVMRRETRIEHVRDGVGEQLIDPRPLNALDDEAWGEMAALVGEEPLRIILTPPECYAANIELPRRIGRRLAQAAALQLGEVAPLPPDRLRWSIGTQLVDGERLRVEIVMARMDRIEAILAMLATAGLPQPAIWADAGSGPVLLEAVRRTGYGLHWDRSPWVIAAVLLLSIPLTTTILASLLALHNAHAAAALADEADRVMREEGRARGMEVLREELAPIARALPASKILDELAGRLPKEASLESAMRDPHGSLTLVIATSDADSVRGALAADPLFRFTEADETVAEDGRVYVRYSGRTR